MQGQQRRRFLGFMGRIRRRHLFQQHTKEETIQTLKEALEVLEQEESDPENDEMIEIINSTVGKLQQIEDKYYYSLDLNYYLNNLENDAYEA